MRLLCLLLLIATTGMAQNTRFAPLKAGLKQRTPILTYHDMIPVRDSNSLWFDCSVDEFKAQLDWLQAKKANFVSLDQLYRHLTEGATLPPHSIAITFADNYQGFYDRAWPILKARRIPVAMFVHTGYVGNQSGRPKMTWEELKELQQSGLVTVASQTVSHPEDLRELSDARLAKEMDVSKRSLELHLGKKIDYIAYPNGKWDERAVAAARLAGYLMGFTEELRPAEKASSILAVPRYVHTKYRQAWADSNSN